MKAASGKLPDFTADGVLPPDDYPMTFDDLRASMLVQGRPGVTVEPWDSDWRGKLVDNAAILVKELWEVGIEEIFFDGSFVENNSQPGDIDGYFECPWSKRISGELERDLNRINPYKVWTWKENDRVAHDGKHRLPMWMRYRVELYPHLVNSPKSVTSGILDAYGYELEFPAAFRQSRSFIQKGIIKIMKQ